MPPDLTGLIGNIRFERARGVVMELRRCDAHHALGILENLVSDPRAPVDLLAALLDSPMRPEVRGAVMRGA